ncbi:hypothetical protein GLAREA_00978 [Glarea lozoyensis ATCC 20868]|uniref:Uncharacterized protein n=1 Tax=Glarea lozoyensis (strain ATCC 20868 / MF5171) TaxID=1116229 RepID=S3DTW3_GLAL2|nr:uncharacterized protein GLAREA_00978 [Glarea lozoyensis ATCC 20868]EPE29818.1 hypothetical protein GLAREA_00978 [Glarea lozoyensis ATCC 20868]
MAPYSLANANLSVAHVQVSSNGVYSLGYAPHLELEETGRSASLRIKTSYPLSAEEKWSILLNCDTSSNIEKISWDISSELQQCRYCRTEYKVDFEHDNSCKIKFAITIWKKLGQGPEAEDWKAQSHFVPFADQPSSPQPIQFHRGEVASVFQVKKAKFDWR